MGSRRFAVQKQTANTGKVITMKKANFGIKLYQGFTSNPVFPATLILIVVMVLFVPSFATLQNLATVAQQFAYTGIAASGLAFVLISGGNDLSIGANISLSSIIAAIVMTKLIDGGAAPLAGVFAALATGAIIGLLNGLCVSKIGMNAFILTLIMQMLCDGVSLIATDAASIGNLPEGYTRIGSGNLLGVPTPIIIMLAFFLLGQFVLSKTTFGRKLYAVGANRQAAQLVGLSVAGIQIIAFVISGVCAAAGGIILSARLGAATPSAGSASMLEIMSAAIIGGNSLFGGKGSVVGAACGVVLLSLISNGLNLLGVSYYATQIVKGGIILLAVALDYFNQKMRIRQMLKV